MFNLTHTHKMSLEDSSRTKDLFPSLIFFLALFDIKINKIAVKTEIKPLCVCVGGDDKIWENKSAMQTELFVQL